MYPLRPYTNTMIARLLTTHAPCLARCGMIGMGSLFARTAPWTSFSGDGQYGFMPQIPDVTTVDILETGGAISI